MAARWLAAVGAAAAAAGAPLGRTRGYGANARVSGRGESSGGVGEGGGVRLGARHLAELRAAANLTSIVSVLDFGAVGDGSFDNTAAFQASGGVGGRTTAPLHRVRGHCPLPPLPPAPPPSPV
jgi:hypothetical protein